MAYTHLTKDQQYKIQSWQELGMPQIEMADRLNKHRSTISRELARNSYPNGRYAAGHAYALQRQRRKAGKRTTKKLLRDPALWRAVLRGLKEKDSPEQIAGQRQRDRKRRVAHETIYRFLYTERPWLVGLLRQKKGKYRRRHGTKAREKHRELAKKTWITERPAIINERQEMGHWEGDTIIGKEKIVGIATHVEWVSGYGFADKLDRVTAEAMHAVTVRRFAMLPPDKRLSEADDNGREFSAHEETAEALNMVRYFALPYHSWERGSNENWNGLLRQFFPKGTSFATITQRDVDEAVRNLNHRPRKRLNYLTPYEVFVQGKIP
ncbi:MAG: IS30 family transposase [Candidatus Kerfeldbacteria bacterium]|nr:IS30 family transposase [Candidatus Kerfeldbacteria bacterium]